jgi:hypothetical protein
MRSLMSLALLALCLTALAGCAAENDPVGVSALPTEPGLATLSVEECCCADGDAKCAAECTCERECEQEENR